MLHVKHGVWNGMEWNVEWNMELIAGQRCFWGGH